MKQHESLKEFIRYTLPGRLLKILVTLVVIVYLVQFGLIMAERGRKGLPAQPLDAAGEAFISTITYVTNHPATYLWHHENVPAFQLVATSFVNSAGLLLFATGLAVLIGVPFGVALALSRKRRSRIVILLLSVLGVSLPSFLLAMLLWRADIWMVNTFKIDSLPLHGFGWDAHLLLPALVLLMRPLAQITQITYVTLSDVLKQDYIRLAYAKGLSQQAVINRHALKNTLISILTAISTSLRFSLASLPIVESFFIWPGVGLLLLDAINLGNSPLVVDLIVSLGFLFLIINVLLEFLYPLIDARLREHHDLTTHEERRTWRERWQELTAGVTDSWARLRARFKRQPAARPIDPLRPTNIRTPLTGDVPNRSRWWLLRITFSNAPLLIGLALVGMLIALVFSGDHLTTANPYTTHGVMMVEGKIGSPPYPPSSVFPWGSDLIGRDIQALVLWGARQTIALAFFGMVARILIGTLLGAFAGWWPSGRIDRLVNGAISVWAAFPFTLFAMLLIQGLGIQQGTWVFVVALGVVGWGEVAQYVRGQVILIKPQPYIEAARAIGVREGRTLSRHVFPNLVPSLVVLAVLEMGGVLMLLAELGFLNIFLGGGFRAEIGEAGRMVPMVYYFSDVPEWSALLANIRNWWLSYPWLVWYAGVGFFMSIMSFNLLGEGLRRFLDESRINVGRLFNRYTALAAAALGLIWILWTTAPVGVYANQAAQFDANLALEDIRVLSSPAYQGREMGTAGADQTRDYIAQRMAVIGLSPAGVDNTYFQSFPCPRFHLIDTPALTLTNSAGVSETLKYRQDFVEYIDLGGLTAGTGAGKIVGVAIGPDPETSGSDPYLLSQLDLRDKIIVIRDSQMMKDGRINTQATAGTLIVTSGPLALQRKYLYPRSYDFRAAPAMYITPAAADRLLATAGSSLADLDRRAANLAAGQVAATAAGTAVQMNIKPTGQEEDMCYNVIGFIPGTASRTTTGITQALDSQVIMVSAYYDGLGVGPDGTLYPGANDNASGVASMLEMARALKQSPYQPKKTIMFVSWFGGERGDSLSVKNVVNAKLGFNQLTVEAVIELTGMGAGSGQGVAIGAGSSYRLVQLYQLAADRLGIPVTTRGRDPHFGLPTAQGFGGRSALSIHVSWDGSDQTAHLPEDNLESIDVAKLSKSGQVTLLTLMVLSRETEY